MKRFKYLYQNIETGEIMSYHKMHIEAAELYGFDEMCYESELFDYYDRINAETGINYATGEKVI